MFYIIMVLVGLSVLGIDQFTKYYISTNFELGQGADFIKGFIDLCYIHNKGAAWGMLSGQTWVLLVLTLAVMVICIVMVVKSSKSSKLLLFAITLVLSGGLGNLIDRVFRGGNVVDFLHFEFWPTFPVFNVADCAIVVGAGFLILYFLLETVKEYKEKKETEQENGDI